ncbi:transcription factor Tfb4 [Laetiporus sulphureus 93-53]|uniref:General transcription and DNA repair factor IIH subunit TFB4 n=1 Tax=Laetiporus sulphureus 93-53 TaxID=1314785 RepID=A0A165F435_9APHY|nr:transcription factor Tfb4 [Laetiporus sulphureus 93-53]KZT08341.1 transcription factor Tfb4 [Laetiporus sulphureus 93-53]
MDTASHLSVIVDLSPTQWYLSSKTADANPYPLSLDTFFSQLFVFLNSHIACKDENTLTVYGALPGRSILLYSSTGEAKADQDVVADANTYRPFNVLDSTIMKSLADYVQLLGVSETETPIGLVGALTKSLCYINRISMISAQNEQHVGLDPRILVLSVSPDQSSSYIPIMNSIFSAQKLKVTVDVCKIYGPNSVFLQQAAHLTGGSYVHLDHPNALLQYLTMSFLPPPGIRQLLSVPTQDKIDFRAACFCHKRIVDIGFVCSVCLSIFCQPVPVCSTCRTKFPIKTLQRLNAARPMPVASMDPSAPSLPSSTSIRVNAANGNGVRLNGAQR